MSSALRIELTPVAGEKAKQMPTKRTKRAKSGKNVKDLDPKIKGAKVKGGEGRPQTLVFKIGRFK